MDITIYLKRYWTGGVVRGNWAVMIDNLIVAGDDSCLYGSGTVADWLNRLADTANLIGNAEYQWNMPLDAFKRFPRLHSLLNALVGKEKLPVIPRNWGWEIYRLPEISPDKTAALICFMRLKNELPEYSYILFEKPLVRKDDKAIWRSGDFYLGYTGKRWIKSEKAFEVFKAVFDRDMKKVLCYRKGPVCIWQLFLEDLAAGYLAQVGSFRIMEDSPEKALAELVQRVGPHLQKSTSGLEL